MNGPVAYWSALLHLLVYGLGWVRPDRGMRWWQDSGKPTTDRTLRFVARIWDADGQLDWFAAWLWSSAWLLDPELVKDATGYTRDARTPLPPDDRLLRPAAQRQTPREFLLRSATVAETRIISARTSMVRYSPYPGRHCWSARAPRTDGPFCSWIR